MDKDSQQSIAERLKEVREYLGFTQSEVAEYLGIPRSAISLLENGKRKIDSSELVLLSRLYQKPVEYWTNPKEKPKEKLEILQRAVGKLDENDVDQVVKFAEFLSNQSKSRE